MKIERSKEWWAAKAAAEDLASHIDDLERLVGMATQFAVTPHDPHQGGPNVVVEFRGFNIHGVAIKGVGQDEALWCVKDGSNVLNRKGEWEFEMMPSSRTDAFLKRTRYSREDAFAAWEKYADTHEYGRGGWRAKPAFTL
jgi:hypothetical protein